MNDPKRLPAAVPLHSMPPQPKTKELPAVKVPESQLDAVLAEVRACRHDVQLTNGQLESFGLRLTAMEGRLDDVQKRNSDRARSASATDMQHDAAIGTLVADVGGVKGDLAAVKADVAGLKGTQATQLAILERLDKVTANPLVRKIAYALGAAALAYLTARGAR